MTSVSKVFNNNDLLNIITTMKNELEKKYNVNDLRCFECKEELWSCFDYESGDYIQEKNGYMTNLTCGEPCFVCVKCGMYYAGCPECSDDLDYDDDSIPTLCTDEKFKNKHIVLMKFLGFYGQTYEQKENKDIVYVRPNMPYEHIKEKIRYMNHESDYIEYIGDSIQENAKTLIPCYVGDLGIYCANLYDNLDKIREMKEIVSLTGNDGGFQTFWECTACGEEIDLIDK